MSGADLPTMPLEAEVDGPTRALAADFVRARLAGDPEAVAEVLAALGLEAA